MSAVAVKKYRGDRRYRRGLEQMTRAGWRVEAHTARKAMFSLLAGIFTRKQIHTVTFVRET